MNKGQVCICYEYLQRSVTLRRGRLKMIRLSGKLLFVIHLGAVGSVGFRRLRKMEFKMTSSSAQLNVAVDFSAVSTSRLAKGSESSRCVTASPSQYFEKLSRPSAWCEPRGQGSRAEAHLVALPQGTAPAASHNWHAVRWPQCQVRKEVSQQDLLFLMSPFVLQPTPACNGETGPLRSNRPCLHGK